MNGGGLVCRLPEVFAKAIGGTVAAFLLAALVSLALPTSAGAQTITLTDTNGDALSAVAEDAGATDVTVTITLNAALARFRNGLCMWAHKSTRRRSSLIWF